MSRFRHLFAGISCCLLLFPIANAFSQTNLVQNGTFGTAGSPSSAGWNGSGCAPEVNSVSSYGGTGNNPVMEVDDLACGSQEICVLPGLTYTLTFVASRRTNGAQATISTLVRIESLNQSNGVVSTSNNTFSRSNTTFSLTTQTYTITPASTVRKLRISFIDATGGGSITLGMIIDDVSLTATDPVISASPTATCINSATAFSITGAGTGILTNNWTFGTDATPQTSSLTAPSVSWSIAGSKPVQATVSNGTCVVYTLAGNVTVNALPTITLGTITAACQGATSHTIPYTAVSNSPNQYSLSSSDLTGFTTVTNATLPASPINITLPSNAAAGTYNFTLSVRNSTTGCVSANVPFTLTINPTPAVTAPANGVYCHGGAVPAQALTGTPSGVTYDITGGAAIGLGNQTGVTQVPAFTATNTGTSPVTATITITPKANGCTGSAKTYTITVSPVPTTANAGADQNLCNVTTASLTGNTPVAGTGLWTKVSGPAATITNASSASATLTGLTPGTYVFRWTISSGNCTVSTDDVTIVNYATPTTAAAGNDQSRCNVTTATLGGNTPIAGTGAWTKVSGPAATITDAANASTTVTALTAGTYVFRWTITNGNCTSSADDVQIVIAATPTTSNAGPDQTLCNVTSATMAANAATAGTGQWHALAGSPTTPVFTDPSSPVTTVTGLAPGTYEFVWVISNSPCTASVDNVKVVINALPTVANAGADQTHYNSGSFAMTGNTPTIGTGTWTVVTGNATIVNPNAANSTVTIDANTSAILRWTISNGNCAVSSDDVTITYTRNADLKITKSDAGSVYQTGKKVIYTITVENLGPSDALAFPIEDIVPAQLENVTWNALSTGNGVAANPSSGSGNTINVVGTIPFVAGNKIVFTVEGFIKQSVTGGVVISNTAIVSAGAGIPDPAPGNNTSAVNGTVENNPPVANDDRFTSIRNVAINGEVLSNDSDPENDPLTVNTTPVTPPANGTLVLNANGTFTYTAAPGFTGTDGFVYTVCDNKGACAQASVVIEITAPVADLTVTKTVAPSAAVAGSPLTYTITITNAGPSTILSTETFEIDDDLPSGFTASGYTASEGTYDQANGRWTGVEFTPGKTLTLTIAGNVNASFTGTSLVNTAGISLPPGFTDPTPSTGTATVPVTRNIELQVIKTDGKTTYVPGTNATYTITVTNTGPSDVIGAQVNDALPAGITAAAWNANVSGGAAVPVSSGTGAISQMVNIPVNGSVVYTFTLTVPSAFTGNLVNSATVTAPAGYTESNTTNNTATDTDTPDLQYDISISKTAPSSAVAGGAIHYEIVIQNEGPSDVVNAVIADAVPASIQGTTWTVSKQGTATTSVTSGTGNNISFTGSIPAGSTNRIVVTIDGTIAASATGVIQNTASITPAGSTAINSNPAFTTLQKQTGLTLVKSGPASGSSSAGSPIEYIIQVTNAGPSDATGIVITDVVPADVTNVSWTAVPRGSASVVTSSGTGNNISTTGNIAAGAGNVIEVRVNGTVRPSFTGVLTNVATATPPGGTAATDSDVTTIENTPGLTITKAGPAQADAGGAISYTLTIGNTGPSDAVNATIADIVHADIANVQWSAAAAGTAAILSGATGTGNNVSVSASIPAGSGNTITVQITGTVKPGASGTARNTASVQVPGQPAVVSNEINTSITNRPGISVTKTGPDNATAGELITYQITVLNAGPSDAFNVLIKDTLPVQLLDPVLNAGGNGNAAVLSGSMNGQIAEVVANIPAGSGNSILLTITGHIDPAYTGDIFNRSVAADIPSAQVKTTVTSNPDVKITKAAPANVAAGGNIVYTLTVTNEGLSDAPVVDIEDLVPADVINVQWTAIAEGTASVTSGASGTGNTVTVKAALPAGPSGKITITITGKVNPAATATLVNSSKATPQGKTPVLSNTTNTLVTSEPDLQISKAAPASVSAGNAIVYTITASNSGLSDARNISITDLVEADVKNVSWTAVASNGATVLTGGTGTGNNVNVTADIPAGTAAINITINGTVDPAFLGGINNTATATVNGKPPVSSNANTNVVNTAAVRITKTGPVSNIAGTQISYNLIITNDGPSDAKRIVITDLIPAAILNPSWTATPVGSAALISGGTGSGNNLDVRGSIPAGSGNRIMITVNGTSDPSFEGAISNSAIAQADGQPAVYSDTVKTDIVNKPNLQVSKQGSSTLAAGSSISYTISVSNPGPASDAKNITISDIIPAAIKNATWTVVPSGNTQVLSGATGNGNTVTVTANIPSAPASDLRIFVTGDVDPNFTGALANHATVQVPGQSLLSSDAVTTTITNEVAVKIVKSAPPKLAAGEPISYTLNITNSGPSNANNLQIKDTVPAAITNVTWTATAGGAAAITSSNSGTGNIIALTGNIPAGVADAITVTVTGVIQPAYTGASIENRAYALPDGKPVESDTVTTVIENRPGINIVKSGPPALKAGQPVNYTISITNTGPSDAVALAIKDTINAAILNPAWTVVTNGAGTSVSSNTGTGNIDITGNIPAGSGNKIDITITGTLDPAFSGTTISNTAHAIPAGLPGVSSATTANTDRSADVRISKSGPSSAVAGENITYTLTVSNAGPSNATGIIIKDTVPALITNITWTAVANGNAAVSVPNGTGNIIGLTGNVAADGSTITITVNGRIDPAAPNGAVTNTARVIPPAGVTDFAEAAGAVTTNVSRQADLVIVKSGPANRTAGESIAYKLVVTNMGLSDVTGAAIIDSLPAEILNPVVTASQTGGASFTIQPTVNNVVSLTGNIPAGSGHSITVNITGQVDPGAQPSSVRNVAKVLPPPDVMETVPATNTSTIQTNLTTDVGVLISKSGPASVNVKDQITYTIEVNNTGISNANGINISDVIPPEITGVTWTAVKEGGESTSVSPTSGSGNQITLVGNVEGLALGVHGRIIITVVGTVSTSAGLTITNTASAEFGGRRESTVITSVNKSVDLQLNKTAPAVIAAGEKISYVLTLSNSGPADAMAATITDNVPAAVQHVSWTAAVSGGAAVSATSGTGNNIALTGDIPANTGRITITIEGIVDPAYTGALTNTAQAEPAPGVTDPRPAAVNVTTNVIKQTGLSVIKSGPASIQAGLPVTYTLNVYNGGPSATSAVSITDLVPAQITNVTWSSSASGGAQVTANSTGTGNQVGLSADMPAKSTVVVTIQGVADPAFNGIISNTATAGNADQTVTSDSLKTNIIYAPALEVSKSGPDVINAGQPVNYIITLTNNGPSIAQNVSVTDLMPPALTNISWSATANGAAVINGGNLTGQTGNVGFAATIPPGTANNIIVTVNAVVNPDAARDIMTNIVSAIPGGGLPAVADTVATIINNTPALRLIKSAPTELGAGSSLNYNIDIFNDGPSNARMVTVNDVLPPQLLNAVWSATAKGTATIAGGNLTGQTGNVNFTADIPAGAANSISVSITGKADPAFTGTVQNTAKATPQGGSEVSSNTTSTAVLNNTGLNIIKTGPSKASAGTIVSYHIELNNNGPSDAQNIAVADVIPLQLQNAVWSATASGSATIAGGDILNRTGNVNLITTIPAGTGNLVTISVTGTLDPAFTGTVTNVASYTKPGEPAVNSTPVVTNVTTEAGIQLSKSGPDSLAAGNRIRYVVLVQNAGPSNSGNIVIMDTVPAPIRAISWAATATGAASIQGATTGNGSQISLPVNIPAGNSNSIMLTIEGTIPPSFTGVIKNRALAKSGDVVLALDSINTEAYSSTSLNVIKAGPDMIAAGLPIHYTIDITNGGPSTATNTIIKDAVPAQIRNVQWNAVLLGGAQLINDSPESGTSNDIQLEALIPAGINNIVRINVTGTVDPGFQGTLLNTAIAQNINGDADTAAISTLVQAEDNLQVVKTGPVTITAGNIINYLITVSNAGPSDLNGIDITDQVPAAITGVTWVATITGNAVITSGGAGAGNNVLVKGNIPGGTGNTIQIAVNGIINADATGTVSNTATVKKPDGSTVSTDPEITQIEQNADLRIQKVAPDKADAGTAMEYIISLQNNGPSNIKNMTVRDTVPSQLTNVTWKATATGSASVTAASGTGNLIVFNADLAAGAANQVRLQITGTIQPTFAGTITNMAVAEAGKRFTSNTTQTTVGRNADLSITKTGRDNVINTDSMSYTITASNAGSATADGAVITDELPAAMENINARVTATTGNAGNVALTITGKQLRGVVGTFPAGGSVRIVVTGIVNGTGRMSNTASITPPAGVQDPDGDDNVTPAVVTDITPQTKLKATKEILTPAPYPVGGRIRYRLTVNNPGLPALNPVIFTDQLPSRTKVTVPVITAPAKGTAVYDATTHQIRWTIGFMEGNSSTQLEYEMTIIDTGAISNKAVVAVPGTGTFRPALPDSGSINIASEYLANLKVVKELNTAAPYKIRDVINFTITLSNAGPNKATRVVVEDVIAANLDVPRDIIVSAGATSYNPGTRRFVWTLDSLAANGTATLRFSIRINSGGSVTNTATGTSAEKDLVPGDNTAVIPEQPITGEVVFIPNSFTPNGDGKNDKLVILDVTRFPGSALIIYNRWGNVVYQSKDYQNNWDGSGLNEGTYFYTLELRTPQGIRVFKGWIELLR